MPGRVLVVDDLATHRLLIRAPLAASGYQVLEAVDDDAALTLAVQEQPDAVLLNVPSPGFGGLATCRRLKAEPATAHLPVVLVTGRDQAGDRVQGLDAGADEFLCRPFHELTLLSRVSSVVSMKQMRDQLPADDEMRREVGGAREVAGASVLVVWDDPVALSTLGEAVRDRLGCAISTADGQAAVRALTASNDYDAILIGPKVRDGAPIRIASVLRSRPDTRQLPVLMVLDAEGSATAHTAIDMGVADFLLSPIDMAELIARLRVQLCRHAYAERLRLPPWRDEALADEDPLTGLPNRRQAHARLSAALADLPAGAELSVVVVDLDAFSPVNAAFGHPAGDAVLREVAKRLQAAAGVGEHIARIGGKAFLLMLSQGAPERPQERADALRKAIEARPFRLPGLAGEVRMTVTVGWSVCKAGDRAIPTIAAAERSAASAKHPRQRTSVRVQAR